MKKLAGIAFLLAMINGSFAAEYVIDGTGAGMHSGVSFKASHVGISSLWGRFNDISGSFTYDADNAEASSITVNIDPASLDTNHEARDTHLKTSDYLDVEAYPQASFVSTSVMSMADGSLHITGDFTLHGETHPIDFVAVKTGEGDTPFGDYRVGFEAEATVDVSQFGINIFPTSDLTIYLAIEGVRQ